MNKPKLLLVDDDYSLARLFGLYFEDDFAVHLAGSVSEAQAALDSINFDMVVTDYCLPDGTATDLLEGLKGAKVILFSGADLDRECLNKFDKAIMKPSDLETVERAILSLQNNS